ncbi:MAG TPA: hypothetical protein P5530_03765 [Candidatus Diapherotrites archaeon]|jgi:DNA-binding Lrp family transcriptional regulator|nr:hypothetical protein [Candidatus Diapherotrites archaeon]
MDDSKKILDPIRIKILSSMRKQGVLVPNIRQLKKHTGFHRATIKSSIELMEKQGLIKHYIPTVNSSVAGYGLRVWTFLQMDISNQKLLNNLKKIMTKIPNIYHCSEVITERGYNIAIGYLAKNVEDYYNNIQRKYFINYPDIYNNIKDRSVFYLSDPTYIQKSHSSTIIDILEKEQGIE